MRNIERLKDQPMVVYFHIMLKLLSAVTEFCMKKNMKKNIDYFNMTQKVAILELSRVGKHHSG